MSTKQDFSLIPDSGRIIPSYLTSRNNWEFITQYFIYATSLGEYNISIGDWLNDYVLFFGQDRLLLGKAYSHYPDVNINDSNGHTYTIPEPTLIHEVFPQSDPSLISFMVSNETSLEIGQVMTGITNTEGVIVTGYPASISPIDDYGNISRLSGSVLFSGSECHGQPYMYEYQLQMLNETVPIVLAEGEYTQAMKNAGNRVSSGGVDYIIVGLWAGLGGLG